MVLCSLDSVLGRALDFQLEDGRFDIVNGVCMKDLFSFFSKKWSQVRVKCYKL